MNKTVLTSFIILCLLSTVLLMGSALNIQIVKATGTIYIRADGSIDPPTAPISSFDNVTYTFTDNITDSIVVERDNIRVDGAGYTLQGAGSGIGIYLSERRNVTIKNLQIKTFAQGIRLTNSSSNIIYGNNITNNTDYGIYLSYSSSNTLTNNDLTDNRNGGHYWINTDCGIYLYESLNNNILGNNITNNYRGVRLASSSNNNIHLNYVENNDFEGVVLETSTNNSLSGNVMNGNKYNLVVLVNELSHFIHSINVSNLVCGKPVYYLVNQTNLVINPETYPQVGYLALVNCVNVTVEGLTLTNNGEGLVLANTNNSRIAHNNITNNLSGIELRFSFNNTLSENNITSYRHAFGYGTTCGVVLIETSNTLISENDIIRNNYGILVRGSSSNNVVSKNNITNNNEGITILSGPSSNTIVGNHITNSFRGIMLNEPGKNNRFSGNTIINHEHRPYSNYAIWALHTSNNTFSENNITDNYGGIKFFHCDYNKLYRNNLSNNDFGIWLRGYSNHNIIYESNINSSHVQLNDSLNNTIYRNNMTKCGICLVSSSNNNIFWNSIVAISLGSSNYNNISGNSIVGSSWYGIRLSESSNNVFRNNRIADNRYNFDVWGKTPSDFVNDVDTSNTVDGRPVYYWIGRRDTAVPLNAGCVILVNCTNITAKNLNLKNNGQGILLACTTNSVITQSNMTNNDKSGVYMFSSSSNSVFGNNVTDNRWSAVALYSSSYNNTICGNGMSNNYNGIYLSESSNNTIYHNNFINNTQQVYDDSWHTPHVSASTNVWDDGYPSGGNYWSDCEERYPDAEEIDDSGIWDTPYVIDENNQDNYPLMEPWSPPPSIAGDLNNDGIVDISDMATAGKAFGSYPGHPRWDSTADMNNDDVVNIFDLALIARNFGKTA